MASNLKDGREVEKSGREHLTSHDDHEARQRIHLLCRRSKTGREHLTSHDDHKARQRIHLLYERSKKTNVNKAADKFFPSLRNSGTRQMVTQLTDVKNQLSKAPGHGRLRDKTHLKSSYEVEHSSDFVEQSSETTNQHVLRSEATYVDKLTYTEVGQMCDNLNLDVTDSTEENKNRIKQRLFSGQRIHSCSQEINDGINIAVQRYQILKTKLIQHYSDVIATVQEDFFKTNISQVTEKMTPCYEERLQSNKTMLETMTDEFEIVVSGETSSGKSTFLNVLLGEKILPTHHLHTTESLCRIHKSENRKIEFTVGNTNANRKAMKSVSREVGGTLKSNTQALLSKHEEDEPLTTMDLYWPISSLHKNVVLIDTPGIGETDVLTKKVFEYLPNCAGYIFIINSSHAGGVQDSGIKKLIQTIAVSSSNEYHGGDASSALFVCNKWDMVEKEYREEVLENTKQKIRKYHSDLEEWQIVTFNANLELQLLQWTANPTEAFKSLLRSLNSLMIRTIENRLGGTSRWLHAFAMDVNGLVNAQIYTANMSKEKLQIELEKAKHEVDSATTELKECTEVTAMIEEEETLLLQDVQKHIKSADVRAKHFDWTICDLELSKVEQDGAALVNSRLDDAIWEWVETGPLKQALIRITAKCEKLQGNIDSRISKINNLNLGFNLQKPSWRCGRLSAKGSVISYLKCRLWEFVADVCWVVGTIPGFLRAFANARQAREKLRIEKMNAMTTDAICKLLSGSFLQNFITRSCTGPHRKWLIRFERESRCTIASTSETMIQMEQNLDMEKDALQMFKSLQRKLNKCSRFLEELERDN